MAVITIKTEQVGCRKPGCKRRLLIPHRHHRKCESVFRGAFSHTKSKSKKYKAFVKRYYQFHPDDVVILCPWHHCEIHKKYDKVIKKHIHKRMKRLRDFSWGEAQDLMFELEELCKEWEKEKTPGLNPVFCNFKGEI